MKLETIIARRIRQLRLARSMTQETLADASGLKPRSIAAIEQGARTPSIAVLAQIAKGLDVEPWRLLSSED